MPRRPGYQLLQTVQTCRTSYLCEWVPSVVSTSFRSTRESRFPVDRSNDKFEPLLSLFGHLPRRQYSPSWKFPRMASRGMTRDRGKEAKPLARYDLCVCTSRPCAALGELRACRHSHRHNRSHMRTTLFPLSSFFFNGAGGGGPDCQRDPVCPSCYRCLGRSAS